MESENGSENVEILLPAKLYMDLFILARYLKKTKRAKK